MDSSIIGYNAQLVNTHCMTNVQLPVNAQNQINIKMDQNVKDIMKQNQLTTTFHYYQTNQTNQTHLGQKRPREETHIYQENQQYQQQDITSIVTNKTQQIQQ